MAAYYKKQGVSLANKLSELYEKYGYSLNKLLSYTFEGEVGMEKMQDFMKSMREAEITIGDFEILKVTDYSAGIDGLPKSDVLQFNLCDDCSVIIRPSGTEPKLKFYLFANGETEAISKNKIEKLNGFIDKIVK